ncbi:MAG: hypothetical protein KIH08_09110 [Candidatus Freyarchaeota archaeon]|nr:hypothetical protein [Candidatus Jordarchaeia archaeon]MBS7280143.1 hypothetical protein [Candidatus Jordarchaeia archaeon]
MTRKVNPELRFCKRRILRRAEAPMKKVSEIIKECMSVLRGDTNPFNIPIYEYAVELQENLSNENSKIFEHSEALYGLVMVHEKKINEAYKLLFPDFPTGENLKNKLQGLDIDSLSNLIKLRPVVKLNLITTAGLIYSLQFLKGREYASLEFPPEVKAEVKADTINFYDEPPFMDIVKNFLNILRESKKAELPRIIRGENWEETVRKFMAFTFLLDSQKIKVVSEGNKRFLEEA